MAKELLKREEVKVEDTWDLTDMYESNEAWEEELNKIEALITEIAGMEGTCLDTAKNLLTVLEKDAACCVSGDVLPRAFKSHADSTSPLFVDSKGTVDHVGQCGIVCLALKCLAA